MSMGEEVSRIQVTPTVAQMSTDVLSFLQHVQLFYIEAAMQIKKRFPIDDPILKSLVLLNPSTINSTSTTEVISLARKFPNIISTESELQLLDDEWREVQFLDPNDLPSTSEGRRKHVVSFWGQVDLLCDTSGNKRFPSVSKLMTTMLSLPHSNADVERISSQVVLIKTKQRNCLKPSTFDAVLMMKQSLSTSTCVEFKPPTSMYKRMNNTIYDSDSDSD